MNNRQKELLRILLVQNERTLNSKDLAARLAYSEKTVRNDLDRLEYYLSEYPSASFILKPNRNYSR
ncbi:HTH domain-containing protein [Neobacillus mesonae]|uniref:HTH domain-containing protein n=1 Tax=Neobacillus mesonae TaxID=1193713 RepID=UPI0037C8BEC5